MVRFGSGTFCFALAAATFFAQSLDAQQTPPAPLPAGPHYAAGWIHRFLLGTDHRSLWTVPVTVPYLNLDTVGGGLTPTTSGGRFQTRSLRFRGDNGFLYGIRSVDKVPDVLPPELQGTFVENVIQDQTSAAHPSGAGIVAPLAQAAGVLQVDPQLVILPDDPALGEFREEFANMLGYFELRAIAEDGAQHFADATEIIDSDDLFPMLQESPAHQVDTRQYLNARLFDVLIGDWDRHRGQWGWARFSTEPGALWVPVPEDRDQAFSKYDGLFLLFARIGALDELRKFGDNFPRSMRGLTKVGREIDMWFLAGLQQAVWDSVALALQAKITDDVIDAGIARMPPEHLAIAGEPLRQALRSRRDQLPSAARRYYALLLEETELHGTDAAESVTIDRHRDGRVDVTMSERRGGSPYFRRTYQPEETNEIRLYLHEGNDRVLIRGTGSGIAIRIVGGGAATVVDSSTASGVHLYAMDGDVGTESSLMRIDRRAYPPALKRQDPTWRPMDWGRDLRYLPWGSYSPDAGLFIGSGFQRTRFGFRFAPFLSRLKILAGWATAAKTGRTDVALTIFRSNSRIRFDLFGSFNPLRVIKFHGPGNESVLNQPAQYYEVDFDQYVFRAGVTMPIGESGSLYFGPVVTVTNTEPEPNVIRIIDDTQPLGSGGFGQAGLETSAVLDTRDAPRAATRGIHAIVGGTWHPDIWDAQGTYGEAHGSISAYKSTGELPGPGATLAVRVGAKKVWGPFPFFDAAFLGDEETVRLGRQNRYAGDGAAWGNAELRLRLTRAFLLLPGYFGVHGLADAGRVFLSGQSSNKWHTAFGGGVWLSFIKPSNALSVTLAKSAERTGLYVQAGFAY